MSLPFYSTPAFARVVPFLIYIVFLPLGDVVGALVPGFDVRWLYAIQVSLVLLALLAFRRQYTELLDARLPGAAWMAAAILVGLAVFVLWINLAVPYLSFATGKGFDPTAADGHLNWGLAATRLAGAALVVPVMEELFWRSFIARWIDRTDFLALPPAAMSLRALGLSSVVFGLEHGLWFAGILAGLAYGALYRRSANLWIPILAHGVTNAALGAWVLMTGSWSFW